MTLALDTVAATTLAAPFDGTPSAYTVEATIKSVVNLPAEDLRRLAGSTLTTEVARKVAYVAKVALLIQAERAAAHAEALDVHHAGTTRCDGCSGDGVFRFPGGCFENGVWKGKTGQCFRCGGTGRQTNRDTNRNSYYDNHVRRVYA